MISKILQNSAYFLAFFLLTTSTSILAQEANSCSEMTTSEKQDQQSKLLLNIKNGALLIEFPSYHRQVDLFDKMLDNSELSEKSRKRIEKLRIKWIEKNENWIKYIITAFKENYTLSPVRAYIRSNREKINDPDAVIWLDANSRKSKKDNLVSFAVLSKHDTKNQGLEAYILLADNFKPLCSPAPRNFRLNSIRSLFLFGEEEKIFKANRLAKKVQMALDEM